MPSNPRDSGIIRIVDENLRQGFAQVPRPVLRAKGLSVKAKLVYVALLDYAWQHGSCYPGQDRLAEDLDVSIDTVQRALSELKRCKLIDWKRRGLNQPNVYDLLPLSACPLLALPDAGNRNLRHPDTATLRHPETADSGSNNTQVNIPSENNSNIRKAHAKKSDGRDETGEQPTVSDPSVTAQSVSHSTSRGRETDHHAQAAVVPADVPEISPQHSGADPARTRALSDSVPPGMGVEVPSERPGEGFERFRETAAKIRAEVRQRHESKQQEDDRLNRSVAPATSSGMVPLADVLPAKRGRPPGNREDRDHITSYLADFRHELGDEAPLSSSVTRALNIFSRAHIPAERWADCLYQARSITKERSAQITKKKSENATGYAAKNRAPFYFAVLEDLCGLRGQAVSPQPGTP